MYTKVHSHFLSFTVSIREKDTKKLKIIYTMSIRLQRCVAMNLYKFSMESS